MHIIPRKPITRRLLGTTAAVALGVTGVLGAQSFAGEGEEDAGPLPPPGEPFVPEAPPAPSGSDTLGSDALIQTSGATFDETILTKFLPANAFDPLQGSATNANDDQVLPDDSSCLRRRT